MQPEITDKQALEIQMQEKFGVDVKIHSFIAHNLPVSAGAHASILMSSKMLLFAYISGHERLTLGDVKKIISRMGLRAELYLPPQGDLNYFNEVGERKFKEVFPGRTAVTDQDIAYYRTLAPYNPALVQIAEIVGGEIREFDRDAVGHWRLSVKFSYRRIKAS